MSVTDERLVEFCLWFELSPHEAIEELDRLRALVAELRELAERMRNYQPLKNSNTNGKILATETWLEALDSLLAAHGGQS